MSSNIIQSSFGSGELSPSLFARVDLTKYHVGAATMRNFFVDYRSGASTRPGTKFCNQALQAGLGLPPRLIPFQSSALVPYIIEFGNKYCRFYSFGNPVLEVSFNITGATQASPAVITVTGNNFAIGDWIFVTGVGGMTQLNEIYFKVANVSGAAVTLQTVNGQPINSLGYGTYTSGGTAARVYTIVSPYAIADLPLLKFVQITNTMTLTHPAYAPQILTFVSPTSWIFAPIVFGTLITAPTGLAASATTGTGAFYSYAVTAVDNSGNESVAATLAVSNVVDVTSTQGTITVSWVPVVGAISYNVYRASLSFAGAVPLGAAYGFQESITGNANTTFADSNVVPDFSQSPPIVHNPFAGNNPGACCFFQQRLYYGGSNLDPQTFWASQPGLYNNFNFSDPTQPDDELEDTIVSKQVNAVKNMLPMPGGLIFFTAQGAFQLSSGSGVAATSAVTPINATMQGQTYNGSNDLPPIPINWAVLYGQLDGMIIELNYNIYAAIYTGQDISVLSNHLFFGFVLREWAYAQKPFKIVWAVRNDGTLLSLTYAKEQEMVGWARHDTLGLFQSVASVEEPPYDATYVVVKRFIGDQWNYYVERFDNRINFPYGAEDAWCVDCAIQSALPTPAANITISSSVGTAIFSADAMVFGGTQVGDVIRADGGIATVASVLTSQIITATWTQPPTMTLPNDPNNTPLPVTQNNWTLARPSTVFTGLDYLNGQTVSILADGGVVASQVVVAGSITLPEPATKVIAGLAFTKQLQTMPLDLGNERDTVQGKRKKINAVTIRVRDTRGLTFGNNFSELYPFKEMNPSVLLGEAIPLVTADEWTEWAPDWTVEGQMCFQSTDPLPATILGVIPEITIGDTPGKP